MKLTQWPVSDNALSLRSLRSAESYNSSLMSFNSVDCLFEKYMSSMKGLGKLCEGSTLMFDIIVYFHFPLLVLYVDFIQEVVLKGGRNYYYVLYIISAIK